MLPRAPNSMLGILRIPCHASRGLFFAGSARSVSISVNIEIGAKGIECARNSLGRVALFSQTPESTSIILTLNLGAFTFLSWEGGLRGDAKFSCKRDPAFDPTW